MAIAADPYQTLEELLDTRGLKAGLAFLNGRVAYRFTAIYKLDDQVLRRMEMVDKGGAALEPGALEEVPFEASFCQFALRDGHFLTTDSAADSRLTGHPYQGIVGGYVGLPLQGKAEQLYGTFCHFDFCERPLCDEEFAFLQRVARLLPRYL